MLSYPSPSTSSVTARADLTLLVAVKCQRASVAFEVRALDPVNSTWELIGEGANVEQCEVGNGVSNLVRELVNNADLVTSTDVIIATLQVARRNDANSEDIVAELTKRGIDVSSIPWPDPA